MSAGASVRVCRADEVLEGHGLQVAVDDLVLAVFRLHDRVYVIDDACTHGPGSLSEGDIDGDVVECNFHNGAFNFRTGEVAAAPCMVPIRTYFTDVRDGVVFIDRDRPAGD